MKDLIRTILYEHILEQSTKTDEFKKRASEIHNDYYDYSKVDYVTGHDKVTITCPKHGDFSQIAYDHLKGSGCPKCGEERRRQLRRNTNDDFISKAKQVHGDKYGYDNTNYEYSNKKVTITCPLHGDFTQTPNDHLRGRGCPKCRESKGEKYVNELLINNNIEFEPQYTFKDCSSMSKRGFCTELPFDFYLPEYNACIEYDGKGHFEPVFGIKSFESTQRTDKLKTDYCKENGIKLIRVPYTMNLKKVEDYIKSELGIKEAAGFINEYECRYCDDRTKKNIATLSAELQPLAKQFIDKVKEKTGKSLTITDGLRTFQEQDMLYCKGRPKDIFCLKKRLPTGGVVVTNRKGGEGNHNYGNSFDVYFNNGGKIDVKGDITPDVAKIGKDLGLVWGGDFTTIQDAPHFELPKKG